MATDPDGDQVKYTFDWDDGTITTTAYVASGTWVSVLHQWTVEPGTNKVFNVTAIATDEHGKNSARSPSVPIIMGAVEVDHPPTIPNVDGPRKGESGISYQFSFVSSDPDSDKIKYFICWGNSGITTGYFPSGQVVTASYAWTVPAGETRSFSVTALASDRHDILSSSRSSPLIITIAGPSVKARESGLEVEGNETIYVDTEEANSVDVQTNESESVDRQTEESNYIDTQTNKSESVDEQAEEADSVDVQTNESESVDEQAEGDCPLAVDDVYSMASNGSVLKISTPGVLENDQYGGDKSLSVTSHSQPAHAADFAMNSDGSFTYTSSRDYCGEDSFTYKTTGGDCESNEATVTIFIDCGLQNEEEVSLL
jgi:hypothetical protein